MKYLVCNLKNKMGLQEFTKYNTSLENLSIGNVNLVMAFSNIYLARVQPKHFDIASQDITAIIDSTVTGEITGYQLQSLGVKYCLVGHSERRIYKKEINIDFINKINEAQNNELKVIYCIGETEKERETGLTEKTLEQQISEVLNNVELKNIIIAYEPVWAIGTGKTPSKDEIKDVITFIKDLIKEKYDLEFKVLYGGSINPDNIDEFKSITNLDGFLVGGASLNIGNVQKMINTLDEN